MATTVLCIEPSAFGAGDINSDTPYGLTENEKHLVTLKNKVDSLSRDLNNLKIKLNSSDEQIDGLRSVADGYNSKFSRIDQTITKMEESVDNHSVLTGQLQSDFNELKIYIQNRNQIEEKNQENIKKTLKDISTIIDKINVNYISKSDFTALEKRIVQLENSLTISSMPLLVDFGNKTNSEILKEGEDLFAKKEYEKAKPYFTKLVQNKYKPARSNFILGEISYFTLKYSEAIAYYKTSAELYDNAEWIPKLLYHTAISFDKINDVKNANQFYNALKNNYPNSPEAKASPDRK